MSQSNSLDEAIRRLQGATEQVQAVVGEALQNAQTARDRGNELALLAEDRARLAEDLDASNARAATLAHVNREVSRRLDQAIDTIRAVLAAHER